MLIYYIVNYASQKHCALFLNKYNDFNGIIVCGLLFQNIQKDTTELTG
jgi:hypothetical protein